MSELVNQVAATLLRDSDISESRLHAVLSAVISQGITSADVFMQSMTEEQWYCEDGVVKEGSYTTDSGFGFRAISGEKVGFSYADSLRLPALESAAAVAKSIARTGHGNTVSLSSPVSRRQLYTPKNPIVSLQDAEKVALLHRIDQLVRDQDPRVSHVFVRLSISHDVCLMAQHSGDVAADMRPLVHLSLRVVVKQGARTEQGSAGGGGRADLSFYSDTVIQTYVDKAVRQALVNLTSEPTPAGEFPVVLGPGWPGVLLHEAVGHGLEADFNRKGASAFAGKIGEVVASSLCTIVDDATIVGNRGALNVDDEGVQGQCTTLIEAGVLCGYMYDRHNAALMGQQSSGNGRRESYASLPLPRMTSTYMLPGEHDKDEILSSLDRGIYAVDFAGGQVDITSGKFVFSMSEAYWVERGQIQYPVKGATLIGNGVEVLSKVSMVGNDLALDPGIGFCGKDGQSVPVAVGQPTVKVEGMTVGGTLTGRE